MPEHYFTENPASAHRPIMFTHESGGQILTFETDAGVFSREHMDKGTLLLLDAVPQVSGRALDLGCGWGGLGICLLARNPGLELILTDINARAIALTQANLARNNLSAQVIQSDGLAAIPGTFDLIVCNPPIRAGKSVVYRLLDEALEQLHPCGSLYIVIRKQQGAPSAKTHLESKLPNVSIVSRGSGFWVIKGTRGSAVE